MPTYPYQIKIDHGLPSGPLWPDKDDLDSIEKGMETDPSFWAQMMQDPRQAGSRFFLPEYWRYFDYYDEALNIVHQNGEQFSLVNKWIFCDTAMKDNDRNDFSVMLCAGIGQDDHMKIIDVHRGKWKFPALIANFKAFYKRHNERPRAMIPVNGVAIEDKVSGTSLIQTIEDEIASVNRIQRCVDKVLRANGIEANLAQGQVFIPRQGAWVQAFKDEVEAFNEDMTHDFDDQVDTMMDAIEKLLRSGGAWAGYYK